VMTRSAAGSLPGQVVLAAGRDRVSTSNSPSPD
jgi:hypothetical protein